MQVYEGTILTVDAQDSVASYLVEDQGRILYVGNGLPREYCSAPRIHLGSSVACPAFVDTHEHLASFATFHAGLNVMDARSNKEIQSMIRDFAAKSRQRPSSPLAPPLTRWRRAACPLAGSSTKPALTGPS